MSATIVGHAGGIDQPAARYRNGRAVEAHAFRALSHTLPPSGITIDVDHDHHGIGQIVYAELDPSGRLGIVGVLDGDELTQAQTPIYLSSETMMFGDPATLHRSVYVARRAELIGVALTVTPMSVAAQPVDILAGDVRVDRGSWPMSWRHQHPLLARAADALDADGIVGLRHRVATRIVDQRTQHADWDDDDLDGGPPGPVLHRGGGYILSVR